MAKKRRIKRRPPSDRQLLRGATDPGIAKSVLVIGAILTGFAIGFALLVRATS